MRKLLLSVAATAMLASGALAADVTAVPATYDSAGFDWDGFYVGVGVTGSAFSDGIVMGNADLIAGFNITSGDLLFGLEGWIGGYASSFPGQGAQIGAEVRAGYLVSPEALIYLSGGGYAYDFGLQFATIGTGIEFAVSDNMSLDLEYKFWMETTGLVTGHSIGASANWHFN